jgi:peptidoglycan/xylan/chitin deacetylase (PgdA/CDA1 family)
MQIKYKIAVILVDYLHFFCNLFFKKKKQLRVLTFHEIMESDLEKFSDCIKFLKKNWEIITPNKFKLIISNKVKLKRNSILITFDDGYYSQFLVAKSILKKLKIKSIFFIVNDFVFLKNSKKIRNFINHRFFPGEEAQFNKNTKNITFQNLKILQKEGHTIGWHTKTHARCSDRMLTTNLINEIVNSASLIEKKLKIKIDDFAFTFGNFASISPLSLKIAKKKYKFIYSGLRGNNFSLDYKFVIRRDSINFNFSHKLIALFLNGYSDFLYSKNTKIIDKWYKK